MECSRKRVILWSLILMCGFMLYWPSKVRQAHAQDLKQADADIAESEGLQGGRALQLSLKEAIMLGLENNINIRVDRLIKDVRLTDIVFEVAKFDPTLSINVNHDQTAFPLNSAVDLRTGEPLTTPLSQTSIQQFGVGLQQRLTTGADVRMDFDNGRTDILFFDPVPGGRIDPEYRGDLRLTITQPLLKNFGIDVNKTFIKVARNNVALEEHLFEHHVMEMVETITNAYWDLVLSIEMLEVEQETLKAAKSLLENNRAQVEAGMLPSIEVLVAEAEVAAREEGLLVAARTIKDREDDLRRLLNLPDVPLIENLTIVPGDKPELAAEEIPLKGAIETALRMRPDVKQMKRDLDNRGLQVSYAKNQLLPELSFQGGVGLFGFGKDFGDNLEGVGMTDSHHYQAGLVLSIPLGNRSAKSTYNKRRLEAETAFLSLKNLELDIIVEVKKAIRGIETDRKRIKAAKLAATLAKRKAEEEEQRFKAGLSTSHDVLVFHSDLAQARGREIQAIIDLNKSRATLERVLGTILDNAKITLT